MKVEDNSRLCDIRSLYAYMYFHLQMLGLRSWLAEASQYTVICLLLKAQIYKTLSLNNWNMLQVENRIDEIVIFV